MDFEGGDASGAVDGAKAEPAAGEGSGVGVVENDFAVTAVDGASAGGDELDGVGVVGLQEVGRGGEIVGRVEGAGAGAVVAAEAGRGIGIAAVTDVVELERVVCAEATVARVIGVEEVGRVAGVARHPEAVEIGDAAGGGHADPVTNEDGAGEGLAEPHGCAGADVEVEFAVGGGDGAAGLLLEHQVGETGGEIGAVEEFGRFNFHGGGGERGGGGQQGGQEGAKHGGDGWSESGEQQAGVARTVPGFCGWPRGRGMAEWQDVP